MARVTIIDVARRAGVSVASTSRALNGLVASAETVQKVHAAAADLGYTADATARSLKLGRTQQLAYAVADIGNPVYVEMMGAIERVVAASDYRLVISSTGDADSDGRPRPQPQPRLRRRDGALAPARDGRARSPRSRRRRCRSSCSAACRTRAGADTVMADSVARHGARRRPPRRRGASSARLHQRPRRHHARPLPSATDSAEPSRRARASPASRSPSPTSRSPRATARRSSC